MSIYRNCCLLSDRDCSRQSGVEAGTMVNDEMDKRQNTFADTIGNSLRYIWNQFKVGKKAKYRDRYIKKLLDKRQNTFGNRLTEGKYICCDKAQGK